ncbi:hypothetical protein ACB092_12G165900 [Castanea dentata]
MNIWGWFEMDLMQAWKNMFPLTETSKNLGYLPLKDEAWSLTLNPWWRFLIDRPAVPLPLMSNLERSEPILGRLPSKKYLTEAEAKWTQPVIVVRKILQDRPMECIMMGHLHRVKLIQFAEPMISRTILIKASQETLGIIKHSTTLFRGRMESKREVMEAWRLRDTEDKSSLTHFESAVTQFKIMNILFWNCRGAMKPQIKKTVMDLVNWHMPLIMVIIETGMS